MLDINTVIWSLCHEVIPLDMCNLCNTLVQVQSVLGQYELSMLSREAD